jgi:phosphoglycerol transferase MdoB-like AlkP superfamily enzyme
MNQSPWYRSRYGLSLFWLGSLLLGYSAVRLVLLILFHPPDLTAGSLFSALLHGLHRDLFAGIALTLPLLSWLLITPDRRFSRKWHRITFWIVSGLFWFVSIFVFFVEFFFFDEFKSRFNTVAVDYLIYPQEVFVNIWESYHVGIVLLICAVLTAAWLAASRVLFRPMWLQPCSFKQRLGHLGVALLALGLLAPTINFKTSRIGAGRTLNEIANNGAISFVVAAWTHNLDYAAFYKTVDRAEAYARVRKLLSAPNSQFVQEGESIRRRVAGDPSKPRLNLVIVLEESLGSEFWGCLGANPSLTPEMDRLANEEGLLFTNLYACGNRTVRGMEGVLSSFPPLPGDSIVKRDRSDNVETLARVLKRDGYSTLFLYGGRGIFDGMRSYSVRNGYDRFIEQKHFEHPTFTTIWGVCDEDLFARSIEEFRALSQAGKPFFATLLTVSNHKPFTYPKGRIAEDPDAQRRDHAVKYTDFALGQFFRAAKKEAFWTNTVFAVIADHGARVYGQQTIPIRSYEIPMIVAGPAVVPKPESIGALGCSLDAGPTLLGLIGRPYETLFFGQDLLKCTPKNSRVLLQHNRDIGLLSKERLAVLGLMHNVEFYAGDPKAGEVKLLQQAGTLEHEVEADAIALYQVADDLYMHHKYHLDPDPGENRSTSISPPAPASK